MPLIPDLCRKDNVEFKARMGQTVRPGLENKTKELVFCPLKSLCSNEKNMQ